MKKVVLLMAATVLLVLSLASVAQAAKPTTTTLFPTPPGSPWAIYYDYADNRHLDGTYTQEQLQAYLDDPTIHQYGSRGVYVPLDNLVRRILRKWEEDPSMSFDEAYRRALGGASTNPTSTTTTVAGSTTDYPDTFPFTGFEVLVALSGGLLLLGAGFAARRAPR